MVFSFFYCDGYFLFSSTRQHSGGLEKTGEDGNYTHIFSQKTKNLCQRFRPARRSFSVGWGWLRAAGS